jgi:archaellum component FlaF (FlaF/FlaG flagellin family)
MHQVDLSAMSLQENKWKELRYWLPLESYTITYQFPDIILLRLRKHILNRVTAGLNITIFICRGPKIPML